ncbi:MAG: class I SAM-dependent methyltransferase [Acidimicrobiales bacterium]
MRGQKTGHFLDQRDNRQRVRERAHGARVLDVFSCTGGFSVYAAAGGARSVHSMDLAGEAIETAKRNMALNPATSTTHLQTTVGDAFEVMASMADRGERYDIVIVDPPSFARKQGDVPRALSAYRRLTKLALDLVESDGLLVQASCSSRIPSAEFFDTVLDAAADAGSRVR